MKIKIILILSVVLVFSSCKGKSKHMKCTQQSAYLDSSEKDDQYLGGIKMIPIQTPKGEFKV